MAAEIVALGRASPVKNLDDAEPLSRFVAALAGWLSDENIFGAVTELHAYARPPPFYEAGSTRAWSPGRQASFNAGRWAAQKALLRLGGMQQPVLGDSCGCPVWPEGCCGSITHDNAVAAAAVGRKGSLLSVGIDVEPLVKNACEVEKIVCTPGESYSLGNLSAELGFDSLTVLFSAKESVYKALFPLYRTFLRFRDVEIEVIPERRRFKAHLAPSGMPTILSGAFERFGDRVATKVLVFEAGAPM